MQNSDHDIDKGKGRQDGDFRGRKSSSRLRQANLHLELLRQRRHPGLELADRLCNAWFILQPIAELLLEEPDLQHQDGSAEARSQREGAGDMRADVSFGGREWGAR